MCTILENNDNLNLKLPRLFLAPDSKKAHVLRWRPRYFRTVHSTFFVIPHRGVFRNFPWKVQIIFRTQSYTPNYYLFDKMYIIFIGHVTFLQHQSCCNKTVTLNGRLTKITQHNINKNYLSIKAIAVRFIQTFFMYGSMKLNSSHLHNQLQTFFPYIYLYNYATNEFFMILYKMCLFYKLWVGIRLICDLLVNINTAWSTCIWNIDLLRFKIYNY